MSQDALKIISDSNIHLPLYYANGSSMSEQVKLFRRVQLEMNPQVFSFLIDKYDLHQTFQNHWYFYNSKYIMNHLVYLIF